MIFIYIDEKILIFLENFKKTLDKRMSLGV